MKTRFFPILTLLFLVVAVNAQVKVACVGNSITENWGVAEGKKYPDVLQSLMGEGYKVKNYGMSGRTLLKKGDRPYWKEGGYQELLAWQPDVVIIKLGTNDSKPQNWQYKSEFVGDYLAFIESFRNLPSKPKVFVCYPVPVFESKWGITDSIVKNEVQPLVKQVAKKAHIKPIDLYTPFVGKSQLFYDGVHPNADGTKLLAETVYGNIRKKVKHRKPYVVK